MTRIAGALLALLLVVVTPGAQRGLGSAESIADGVLLYRLDDQSLLDPAGPIAVQALRIDPVKNKIQLALAQDTSPARETVPAIAARRQAIAAVNAGFFALANGAPAGILKSGGRLLGGTKRARGAIGITSRGGATLMLFDRVIVEKTRARHLLHPPRFEAWGLAPRDRRRQWRRPVAGERTRDGRMGR